MKLQTHRKSTVLPKKQRLANKTDHMYSAIILSVASEMFKLMRSESRAMVAKKMNNTTELNGVALSGDAKTNTRPPWLYSRGRCWKRKTNK